jgi:hypothetical protein
MAHFPRQVADIPTVWLWNSGSLGLQNFKYKQNCIRHVYFNIETRFLKINYEILTA